MMGIKNSMKLTVLTAAMAAVMGLTACQKQSDEAPTVEAEAEVPMSAEPAEGNDPVIVADDLDDVDARSESIEEEQVSATDAETDVENGTTTADPEEKSVKEPSSVDEQPAEVEEAPAQ